MSLFLVAYIIVSFIVSFVLAMRYFGEWEHNPSFGDFVLLVLLSLLTAAEGIVLLPFFLLFKAGERLAGNDLGYAVAFLGGRGKQYKRRKNAEAARG